MRLLASAALSVGVASASTVYAQEADELVLYGAMVEAPEGTPLASATIIGGTMGVRSFVVPADTVSEPGVCIRMWSDGPCNPVSAQHEAEALAPLAIVDTQISESAAAEWYRSLRLTQEPLIGIYEPDTDGGVSIMTQNPIGGFERPDALLEPSGNASGMVVLRGDAVGPMSAGAPVAHAEKGLVGVLSRASDGMATMHNIADIVTLARNSGVNVPDNMTPSEQNPGGLPPRVESETGRIYYFGDYSYIGNLSGFYGPSGGMGFDETFVTDVTFSVWEIDTSTGARARIAAGAKALPLIPAGMSLEAPFSDTPGDTLASCVVHATPRSGDRDIVVLQFWRNAPERYNDQIHDKSYDEAAPPLTGWAEGETPCDHALSGIDDGRLAALAGRAPTPSVAAEDDEPESDTEEADWRPLENWEPTGRGAQRLALGSRTLIAGCTESRELVVALTPAGGIGRLSLDGSDLGASAIEGDHLYVFVPADATGVLTAEIEDEMLQVSLAPIQGDCR
ncbi:hypothetical protein OCH239_09865 [Roseivivax halodurans JCM 10272]|uniref:Uncharacterized protein n=2 Tax=Roseivivax halodurans TaxID=93683 RepID=X7EED4_9RHOB|nr:hypothetical protein OCH239_09865 [Roseivivax halodurans JCM 10272]